MPQPPTWQKVFEKLPGALLRVWGRSSRDVYAVGADGDGRGPLALHYDGTKWRRLQTGQSGDLWWVDAVGADDVRMVGKGGMALRYRPSRRTFERIATPGPATLFGVWGSSPSDVWYVGGQPGSSGVIWHDDGTAVRPFSETVTATASAAMFKVHGCTPDQVWIVGERGAAILWDGSHISEKRSGTGLTLFTVFCLRKDSAYAVGGTAGGVIVHWNGTDWVNETPAETPGLNGVFAVSDDRAETAGFNGRIYRRTGGSWTELKDDMSGMPKPLPTFQDLHSNWIDETGGIWAVGGQLASDPPRDGVLIHYGAPISSEIE